LVLAKIIHVLGTGKNHSCSWYWQKSFLFLVLAKIIHVLGTGKTFRHLYKNDRILFKEVLISSGEILQTIICSSYDYKSNEIKKKKK
jgi:hypothetical protein